MYNRQKKKKRFQSYYFLRRHWLEYNWNLCYTDTKQLQDTKQMPIMEIQCMIE